MSPSRQERAVPLHEEHCKPLGAKHALDRAEAKALLARLKTGWRIERGAKKTPELAREFRFDDFRAALAFANKIGALAEKQDHHPDLEVGWGRCAVRFTTHSAHGLTRNDFICAARVDRLKK